MVDHLGLRGGGKGSHSEGRFLWRAMTGSAAGGGEARGTGLGGGGGSRRRLRGPRPGEGRESSMFTSPSRLGLTLLSRAQAKL